MIAHFQTVAIDCPDPSSMAEFYAAITGWDVAEADETGWIELIPPSPLIAKIAFQLDPGHCPPVWPGHEQPMRAHLDFRVPAGTSLDEAEIDVLAIGARKADVQPYPDSFRVYLDPAGHPFCLVSTG